MLKRKASAVTEALTAVNSQSYLAAVALAAAAALPASEPAILRRKRSTRPAVSTSFCLPAEEGVAGGADFDDQVSLVRGAGLERVAAGALDVDGSYFG